MKISKKHKCFYSKMTNILDIGSAWYFPKRIEMNFKKQGDTEKTYFYFVKYVPTRNISNMNFFCHWFTYTGSHLAVQVRVTKCWLMTGWYSLKRESLPFPITRATRSFTSYIFLYPSFSFPREIHSTSLFNAPSPISKTSPKLGQGPWVLTPYF